MNDKKHVFLPGWGFSASIWQYFYPTLVQSQCINMPDFDVGDEKEVLAKLEESLAGAHVIHAWSHSGLWLLKLLMKKRIQPQKIYFYGLPLVWQFHEDAKKAAFIRQYQLNQTALANKFIKLICFPNLLQQIDFPLDFTQDNYKSNLNYLRWMFRFDFAIEQIRLIVAQYQHKILLAEKDAIIDSKTLAMQLDVVMIKGASHLDLLHYVCGDRYIV